MTITVCHLLLPQLFVLFCCHRLAAVHGEFDADNQHNIYNTNLRFKAMRSDLKVNNERQKEDFLTTNSNRAVLPCPDEAAIFPCTCMLDIDNRTYIDCTFVESLDQLVAVFQQDIPVKQLYEFDMRNNTAITEFPSFMNGVTFENVLLSPGLFILASISDQFLSDLKDTLKNFYILNSQLTTDFFPFSLLPSMSQLDSLLIYPSNINRLPQIQAPKLTRFALEYSPLELLESGTFPIGTGPMTIWVNDNQINTIEAGSYFFADQNSADSYEQLRIDLQTNQIQSLVAGTFPLRNGPMEIYLSSNNITSIEPGTFAFASATGSNSNNLISIYLWSNQLQSLKAGTFPLRNGQMIIALFNNHISSIEPGTFVLPASTNTLIIYLDLERNELTTVDEAVFGSVMPFVSILFLNDNPLTCGCDIAWLILNANFLASVFEDATCANGTNVHDLNPQQFIDLC